MGRTPRRQALADSVRREGGAGAPRWPEPSHTPRCPPLAPWGARMRPIQPGAPPGVAPPPPRQARRRLGRAQGVDPRGHLQTPSASSDSRQLCHRLPLVAGHGHAAPPGIASWAAASRHTVSGHRAALLPSKNRAVPPGPLNVGLTSLLAFGPNNHAGIDDFRVHLSPCICQSPFLKKEPFYGLRSGWEGIRIWLYYYKGLA